MKKIITIFIFLLASFLLKAQDFFKTIVPNQPVVEGESFQVQYIIRNAEKVEAFNAPVLSHFRFVSGPNFYTGSVATMDGRKPLRNSVYTLEAISPGRFIIPGATAIIEGKPVRSNDAVVEVISKEQAAKLFDLSVSANSDYMLLPGEDPYEKMSKNIFLKVMVDRTNCFAGEPVLATFKLYSRLESKSDIVKNPGFYGFTVYDMVNLSDKQVNTENVNGKTFDVHTIRKVQLYPLQAGTFIIDAMEVQNKVEFSRSTVNKKTEQEITEGVLGNNDNTASGNKGIFETSISTEPVVVNVKPVLVKNKPDGFSGAVGDFVISAALVKDSIAKNEEGIFEITINGSGNFTQLNTPAISWPVGMEGFEPAVKDSLDKSKVPLTGRRTFRYAFVCAKPGKYQLPSVSFSFFNPASKRYKKISTAGIQIAVSDEEKITAIAREEKISITDKNAKASRIAAGIIVLLVLLILIYWIRSKKEPLPSVVEEKPALPSVDEILAPLYSFAGKSDKEFYTVLQQCIWRFFQYRFSLLGSEMNKENLFAKIKASHVDLSIIKGIHNILQQCEEGVFTGISSGTDKISMLMNTKEILEVINGSLL